MNEAKFTKGEWNFYPEDQRDDFMVISDDNGNVVAYLESDVAFDGSAYINKLTGEQDANANLIATSPELYEFIETHMGGHPEAEALLAKARGEA